jgi:transposase
MSVRRLLGPAFTVPIHNGRTEGVNIKTKMIKFNHVQLRGAM